MVDGDAFVVTDQYPALNICMHPFTVIEIGHCPLTFVYYDDVDEVMRGAITYSASQRTNTASQRTNK